MFRSFLLLLSAAILTSCSSGKTALSRNKFDLAVQKASKRLQQKPGLSKRGHTVASQVLEQAFVKAYEQHQTAIRQLSASSSTEAFRWERVYQEYGQLQTLTDNARRGFDPTCTTCANWLSSYPASYLDRQQASRELAAADRYEAAEQAFAYRQENRLAAKDAYLNYRKAADWVPNYQQATAKAAEALPFAILRVVVEPLSPTHELSQNDNQELQHLILQQLARNSVPSQFVKIYQPGVDSPGVDSPGESTPGDDFPIHQVIQMVVTSYSPFRESHSSSSTTVYSNQEYKVGEKKINDSTKVDVKEKVSGTLTTYRHEIQAGLDLRMRAIDTQTDKILWEEPVWESRSWQSEWQTFSGDDRALNGQSLKTATPFPPSRWQLLDSMRDELAGDVVRRLLSKYKND